MTEQELYYERKNREAKEWQQVGASAGFLAVVITGVWLLWVAWPVLLACAILWLICFIIKTIITTIVNIYKNIIDYCKSTFIYRMFTFVYRMLEKLFSNINIEPFFNVISILLIFGYAFYLFFIILSNRI